MEFDLNKVLKEFNLGNQENAYHELRQYSKKNNKNLSIRYNLAVMEQQLNYEELAIKNYEFILLNNQNHVKSIINLYLIYLKKRNYEYAYLLVNKAILLEDNNQELIRDKSLILYYLKKIMKH